MYLRRYGRTSIGFLLVAVAIAVALTVATTVSTTFVAAVVMMM